MLAASVRAAGPVRTLRILIVAAIAAPFLVFAGASYVSRHATIERAGGDLRRATEIAEEHVTKALDGNRLLAAWINELVGPLSADEIAARESDLHDQIARAVLGLQQVQAAWV